MKNAPRIIVALDYGDGNAALALAKRLDPAQCRLKVGLELFSSAGPAIVGQLSSLGFDIFLDLKFHDIPNTVARACSAAAEMGVWMTNVHLLGGKDMLKAARQSIDANKHRPLLIGVTVLTSHTRESIQDVGLTGDITAAVQTLAQLASETGLDGVVCSPQEIAGLRKAMGKDFLLITPGIRPAGATQNDQQRVSSPAAAIAAGADYLVIGRPLTDSDDPVAALTEIKRQINY
jgi:orotidine-5'-phosphate decarboxylase